MSLWSHRRPGAHRLRGLLLIASTILAWPAAVCLAKTPSELNNEGITEAKAGRFDQGVDLLRQANAAAPNDEPIKKNLSGMLTDWAAQRTQERQLETARNLLEEAILLDARNGPAKLRLGDIVYLLDDDYTEAIRLWKEAYSYAPPDQRTQIQNRIAGAQRDQLIERNFSAITTAHFGIRYEGDRQYQQAGELGTVLDRAYLNLASTVGSPPDQLRVILYSGSDFQRVSGGKDWAAGLYDGRIRLRADEVGSEHVENIVYHELTHAFLYKQYGPGLPVWIHEGFAQTQEPSKTLQPRFETLRRAIETRTGWVPLKWLDRRFVQPSSVEDVERAYVEARLTVERLIEREGLPTFQAFLKKISNGQPVERAFDDTYRALRWVRVDQGVFD